MEYSIINYSNYNNSHQKDNYLSSFKARSIKLKAALFARRPTLTFCHADLKSFVS